MFAEPEPETEYILVRFVDSRLHVATFRRFGDDSGLIRHGSYVIKFEFNWTVLQDYWEAMRNAGWQTLDDAIEAGVVPADAKPSCDCPTYAAKVLDYVDASIPADEISRRIKDESAPLHEQHERILWGD